MSAGNENSQDFQLSPKVSNASVIITTASLNFNYLSYLPLFVASVRRFSNAQEIVGLVVPEESFKEVISIVQNYAQTKIINQLPGVHPGVQAKFCRMWLASTAEFSDTFVTISDLDMVQLSRNRFDLLSKNKDRGLLKWGFDHPAYVGENSGKWPMDGTSAYGKIFQSFINPNQLSLIDLVSSWERSHDLVSESPYSPFFKFSDEALMRALAKKNNLTNFTNVSRLEMESSMMSGRIDRASIHPFFRLNRRLKKNVFELHGTRPFDNESSFGNQVLKYLEINAKDYAEYKKNMKNSLTKYKSMLNNLNG